MQVGVAGLGSMGIPVAANLVKAGIRTIVWNRSPQSVRDMVTAGATAAHDLEDLFQCDIVLSVLLDDTAVRSVVLDSGVLASAPAGAIHACMSSISTALAQDLVRAHEERGLSFAAAAMFGRPEAAAAAQLNMAVAGRPEILDRLDPVLSIQGRVWRMGDDPVLAYLVKTAGNFMIGSAVEAMAEAAALVSSRGSDPVPFFEMMAQTLFPAPIYKSYGAAVATGVFPGKPIGPAFALSGVGRTLGEARANGIRMPSAELLQDRLQQAERQGFAEEDWSVALAKVARKSESSQ